jgi:hypothetical protein
MRGVSGQVVLRLPLRSIGKAPAGANASACDPLKE